MASVNTETNKSVMATANNQSSTYHYNESGENQTKEMDDGFYFYEDIEKLKTSWVNEPHVLPQTIIYGIVFLLGLAGNCIVICAAIGRRSNRNVTLMFMVSLAVADILFLLVVIPHELLRMVFGEWPGGRAFCKVSGFIEMLTAVASILNLTAVSFERYFVIVNPIQSRHRCTVGNTRKLLVFVWVMSACLSAPSLFVEDTQNTTYYNNVTSFTMMLCADHGLQDNMRIYYAVYQILTMFCIPTILMVFCYTVVIYVLWISGRTLVKMTSTNSANVSNHSYLGVNRQDSNASSSSLSTGPPIQSRSQRFLIDRTAGVNNTVIDAIMKGRKQTHASYFQMFIGLSEKNNEYRK
ncbi:tachykinin-like peptides receptor 86C [Dreissena polymorpha]|uniref:tachykinin-like peptides receptor 86C n=1 Tax=Dreissena polymorpha TaxID=45954 RepID=UPI002264F8DF|nr:tachykinin-like peptides receptor 86C [Dreissena polymorpha]